MLLTKFSWQQYALNLSIQCNWQHHILNVELVVQTVIIIGLLFMSNLLQLHSSSRWTTLQQLVILSSFICTLSFCYNSSIASKQERKRVEQTW